MDTIACPSIRKAWIFKISLLYNFIWHESTQMDNFKLRNFYSNASNEVVLWHRAASLSNIAFFSNCQKYEKENLFQVT